MRFIANRLYSSKNRDKRRALQPAVVIATAGVALGVAVMLLSVAIVVGFKDEVGSKVSGFGGDLQALNVHSLQFPEANPIQLPAAIVKQINEHPQVAHLQRTSQKLGVLKTNDAFSAMTLKGVGEDYDTLFLSSQLLCGRFPRLSSDVASGEIMISQHAAERHGLSLGDRVYAYFFSSTIKMRRFAVVGIYQTHLQQFDRTYALTDRYTVNQLNGWSPRQYTQLEVRLQPSASASEVQASLNDKLRPMPSVSLLTVRELYPQVYSWLDMLDLNAVVILVLMLSVAAFTMISGVLILILEHTPTIGVLMALGAHQRQLRQLFFCLSWRIVLRGLLLGNALGLGFILFCEWGLLRLDPATYYLDRVPTHLLCTHWVLVNVATLLTSQLALLLPVHIISKIQPTKAIKFD